MFRRTVQTVAAIAMIAVPGIALAKDLPPPTSPYSYGDLASRITPKAIKDAGGFDNVNDIQFLSAKIVVQGTITVDQITTTVVKEIDVTWNQLVAQSFGRGLQHDSKGQLGPRALPLQVPVACITNGQPVLATGVEYGYYIEWCNSNAAPDSAFKNYYYDFQNGNVQLVLTMDHLCSDASDRAVMPQVVLTSVCQH